MNLLHSWVSVKANSFQGLLEGQCAVDEEFWPRSHRILLANSKLVSGLLKRASLSHRDKAPDKRIRTKEKVGWREGRKEREKWIPV